MRPLPCAQGDDGAGNEACVVPLGREDVTAAEVVQPCEAHADVACVVDDVPRVALKGDAPHLLQRPPLAVGFKAVVVAHQAVVHPRRHLEGDAAFALVLQHLNLRNLRLVEVDVQVLHREVGAVLRHER